ncbi:hypothetical protein BHE74_00035899 [Ensete ventricosum]|nr:hypothetical protein GW17_00061363 [Ensete ventricosum]RWW57323.1 hypothetical protein BHE74_00035899 [Ensete ventricosum]
MRRYDQELGAPLWCTTQQEEGLWIQEVNVVVPQRRVFVCVSKLTLDESISHQHMGAVYHRGRSPSASTSESYGGGRDHVNDQELLGAPLQCRKGRGSDDESSGAQLPKSKASVRKEVDLEERHSAVEADLPIAKEGMQMQGNG